MHNTSFLRSQDFELLVFAVFALWSLLWVASLAWRLLFGRRAGAAPTLPVMMPPAIAPHLHDPKMLKAIAAYLEGHKQCSEVGIADPRAVLHGEMLSLPPK